PKEAKQPKPDEIKLLRAWVAAGARDDTGKLQIKIPDIKPRGRVAAAVSALAYRPDGKLLAAGGHKEVILINPVSGDVTGKLRARRGRVPARASGGAGRLRGVAGGPAGTAGEVRVYAVAADGRPASKPDRTLAAHKDLVHDLAFSSDQKTLATCSYDRLIKLW